MWEYVIESGLFRWIDPEGLVGSPIATCYSGHAQGLNNPDFCAVRNIGPICPGEYTIGGAYASLTTGPITMGLTPRPGTNTFGRSGFLIHGDTRAGDMGASHGCIVMDHTPRHRLSLQVSKGLNSLRVRTDRAS